MDETVRARIAAAFAADRDGDERAAIIHYDAAWRLGVPADLRRRFLVGYGSTLRNVGRADDAVGILSDAVIADPEYPALGAFLALALLDAGHPRLAVATMLGVALDLAQAAAAGVVDPLDGYQRALAEVQVLLAAQTMPAL
jgi:hypothetical protein